VPSFSKSSSLNKTFYSYFEVKTCADLKKLFIAFLFEGSTILQKCFALVILFDKEVSKVAVRFHSNLCEM